MVLMLKALTLSLLSVIFLTQFVLAEESPCTISNEALEDASSIRGLVIKRKTPCLLHDKAEVKEYLLKTIDTKIPKERLRAEALVYRAFGFLPPTFNYEEGLVKLYLDQLGGYYDPIKDHFVMAAWMPTILQVTIAVHELTHALQDQYFDLVSFTDHHKFSSDELLARSALVEGDATAVMTDYTNAMMGQPPLSKKNDVGSIMFQNVAGSAMMPSLREVPESLKLMLMFPYTSGLRFAHELLKKGGYKEIDKAFKSPPRSTEEILHPEKYGLEPDFKIVKAQKADDIRKIKFEDTLGEFAISALLATHEPNKTTVVNASKGWGGDRVAILEDGNGVQTALWRINWDTQKDLEEFCSAYRGVMDKIIGSSPNFGKLTLTCDGTESLLEWKNNES